MNRINTAPCLNCEKRGCGAYHDICEKYAEYNANNFQMLKNKINSKNYRVYKKDKTNVVARALKDRKKGV